MMLVGQRGVGASFFVCLPGHGSTTALMHMERACPWFVMEDHAQRGEPEAQVGVLVAVASELPRVGAPNLAPDLSSQGEVSSPYRPLLSLSVQALGHSHG
jgi:hypothetical protein